MSSRNPRDDGSPGPSSRQETQSGTPSRLFGSHMSKKQASEVQLNSLINEEEKYLDQKLQLQHERIRQLKIKKQRLLNESIRRRLDQEERELCKEIKSLEESLAFLGKD